MINVRITVFTRSSAPATETFTSQMSVAGTLQHVARCAMQEGFFLYNTSKIPIRLIPWKEITQIDAVKVDADGKVEIGPEEVPNQH